MQNTIIINTFRQRENFYANLIPRYFVLKPIGIILIIMLSTVSIFGQPQNMRPERDNKTKEVLINKLEKLENDFSSNMGRRQKMEFKKQIDEIALIIEKLEISESRYYPMANPQFEHLLAEIENTRFDDQKNIVLESAARNNYFLVEQLNRILDKYKFDKEKLDAVKIIYPKVIDKENNYTIYNQFKFNKNELGDYLKNIPKNNPAYENRDNPNEHPQKYWDNRRNEIFPVDNSKLNQIIEGYKKNKFESEKLQFIRTVAENNFFLINQVVQLLNSSKFDSDDTRLSVIQILYPKTLDTENNYLLYDCFTFSSSKEKLGQYMRDVDSKRK